MMRARNALIIVLLLIAAIAPVFSWNEDEKEPATVFGIMGQVAEFVVSLNYESAYAFSLDAENNPLKSFIEPQEDHQLTNRTGLRVANWSFICNTPVNVTITHDKLTNEFDMNDESKIEYELGVQKSTNEFEFILSTETLQLSYPMSNNDPIHFDNYGLFVRLTMMLDQLADYPEGYYYSTISFTATTIN